MPSPSGDIFPGSVAASLAGAAWAWLVGLLLGAALFRMLRRGEELAPATRLTAWTCAGMGVQGLVFLAMSFASMLRPSSVAGVALALLVLGAATGGMRVRRAVHDLVDSLRASAVASPAIEGVALVALAVLVLVAARLSLLPTAFFDDHVYHVGLPRQALMLGHWPDAIGFHHALMPAGWQVLYVLPLSLGGGTGPQSMNVVALALLAGTTWRLARHGGAGAAAGAAASLLVVAPVFLSLGCFAGNDLFVTLALASALEVVVATRGGDALSAGIVAGAAWAAKYVALPPIAGLALGVVLMRESGWLSRARGGCVLVIAALVVGAPWTLRTLLLTGNPVSPAFPALLGGAGWDALSAQEMRGDAGGGLAALATSVRDLLVRSGDMGEVSGLGLAFLPMALAGLAIARRVAGARAFLCVAALSWIGWAVTSPQLRLGLILLVALVPFAAALLETCGRAVLERSRSPRAIETCAAGALSLLLGAQVFAAVERHARVAHLDLTRLPPRNEMLTLGLRIAEAGRDMRMLLPDDAKVLLVAESRLAFMPRPTLASSALDAPAVLRFVAGAASPVEVDERLRHEGITHVLLNERELRRMIEDYSFLARFSEPDRAVFADWLESDLVPVGRWDQVILYEVPARG